MEVGMAEEEMKMQTTTITTTTTPQEGESKSKRKMKIASQSELLEKTYAAETYSTEALWAELSGQLELSDRQLQMWFCHRRLKDRKTPPVKWSRKNSPAAAAATSAGLLPVMTQNVVGKDMVMGAEVGNEHVSGLGSGSSPFGHVVDSRRVGSRAGVAMARIGTDLPLMARIGTDLPLMARIGTDLPPMRSYYEPPQSIIELRAIAFVEAQLGEALREDEPILGTEFDPLPPDAFGAPLGSVGQLKQSGMLYETQVYERPDIKSTKGAARALHEYQFFQSSQLLDLTLMREVPHLNTMVRLLIIQVPGFQLYLLGIRLYMETNKYIQDMVPKVISQVLIFYLNKAGRDTSFHLHQEIMTAFHERTLLRTLVLTLILDPSNYCSGQCLRII